MLSLMSHRWSSTICVIIALVLCFHVLGKPIDFATSEIPTQLARNDYGKLPGRNSSIPGLVKRAQCGLNCFRDPPPAPTTEDVLAVSEQRLKLRDTFYHGFQNDVNRAWGRMGRWNTPEIPSVYEMEQIHGSYVRSFTNNLLTIRNRCVSSYILEYLCGKVGK